MAIENIHEQKSIFCEGMSIEPAMRCKVHITDNAPRLVFNDLLIIGCEVSDVLPATPGDIRALDIDTGELVWTFHTIPRKGKFGANTWPENARDRSGFPATQAGDGMKYVTTAQSLGGWRTKRICQEFQPERVQG